MNARHWLRLASAVAILSAQPAAAAQTTPLARDGVSFLIEFCGRVLGTQTSELEKARKDLDGATLFPAEPVSTQSLKLRDAGLPDLKDRS